jgi:hypothetical protein
MRISSAVLGLTGLASACAALSLPATAASLGDKGVVVTVKGVTTPDRLPGDCVARGLVAQVISGSQFRVGQPIAIKVACGRRDPVLDGAPERAGAATASVDAGILAQAKQAVVHLDDTGAVIWSPSPRLGDRSALGPVAGFRVLDGVKLPLSRNQLG